MRPLPRPRPEAKAATASARTPAGSGAVTGRRRATTRPAGSAHCARTTALCRLAHRRHVKVGNPQRRHRRPGRRSPHSRGSVSSLTPAWVARRSRSSGLSLKPEVVDRRRHLAVLDQVDAVAGQPGQQHRRRVDLTDVPRASSTTARARSAAIMSARLAVPPVITTLSAATATGAELGGGGPRIGQRVDHAVAIQSTRLISMPLSNTDTVSDELPVATNGVQARPGATGSESAQRQIGEPLPTRVPPSRRTTRCGPPRAATDHRPPGRASCRPRPTAEDGLKRPSAARRGARPSPACRQLLQQRIRWHVNEVVPPTPAHALAPSRLASISTEPAGLGVAAPQTPESPDTPSPARAGKAVRWSLPRKPRLKDPVTSANAWGRYRAAERAGRPARFPARGGAASRGPRRRSSRLRLADRPSITDGSTLRGRRIPARHRHDDDESHGRTPAD